MAHEFKKQNVSTIHIFDVCTNDQLILSITKIQVIYKIYLRYVQTCPCLKELRERGPDYKTVYYLFIKTDGKGNTRMRKLL